MYSSPGQTCQEPPRLETVAAEVLLKETYVDTSEFCSPNQMLRLLQSGSYDGLNSQCLAQTMVASTIHCLQKSWD